MGDANAVVSFFSGSLVEVGLCRGQNQNSSSKVYSNEIYLIALKREILVRVNLGQLMEAQWIKNWDKLEFAKTNTWTFPYHVLACTGTYIFLSRCLDESLCVWWQKQPFGAACLFVWAKHLSVLRTSGGWSRVCMKGTKTHPTARELKTFIVLCKLDVGWLLQPGPIISRGRAQRLCAEI